MSASDAPSPSDPTSTEATPTVPPLPPPADSPPPYDSPPSYDSTPTPDPTEASTHPQAPAPFPEYGAYTPAPVAEPAGPGDPLRGLLAGAGVAVLGAILWAVVVYLSKYEIGIIALVIGYAVGYVVHRVGGVATQATAIGAALLAAAGILLGFVLTTVAAVAQVNGVGFFDAVSLISDNSDWGTALSSSVTGVDWLFLLIGAFAAWRLVAGQRRPPRRA
jgi:hypothetical protein